MYCVKTRCIHRDCQTGPSLLVWGQYTPTGTCTFSNPSCVSTSLQWWAVDKRISSSSMTRSLTSSVTWVETSLLPHLTWMQAPAPVLLTLHISTATQVRNTIIAWKSNRKLHHYMSDKTNKQTQESDVVGASQWGYAEKMSNSSHL